MRGTIIMWTGEKGVVAAAGQRYEFDIHQWAGITAPAANMTVDLTVTDDRVTALTPVDEAALAKEKLAEMTGKGSELARAVYIHVGKDVVIAYVGFTVVALIAGFFVMNALPQLGTASEVSLTLAEILNGNLQSDVVRQASGGSAKGIFLVLLTAATVAVPYFSKQRHAPLAFCVPLSVAAYGVWAIYRQMQLVREAISSEIAKHSGNADPFFRRAAEETVQQVEAVLQQVNEAIHIGIGGWILLTIGAYLAYQGITRFLIRARH